MHFYALLAIFSSASVLAVPLLGSLPALPAAGGLGALGNLGGSLGGVDGLSGVLGGLHIPESGLGEGGMLGNVIRRKTKASQPEYINSGQISTSNSCNVGDAQCCQSLHQSSDFRAQNELGGFLSTIIPLDNLMVGLQCQPIAGGLIGLSGSSTCSSQPVCCSGNTYEGLINIGCSPITL